MRTKMGNIEPGAALPVDRPSSALAPAPVYAESGAVQNVVGSEVEAALKTRKRINLQINWASLDREAIFASLKNYDDAENLYPKVPGNWHDTFMLHEAKLKTEKGELLLIEFTKVIDIYRGITKDVLQITITRLGLGKNSNLRYVAAFDFLCNRESESEEWDMRHRETFERYRRQGIGEEVLKIAADIFRERSKDNNLKQSISAKSGQKELTFWLEDKKRGFLPATTEDADNLARLKSPDENLKDVTMLGKTYTFDTQDIAAKFKNSLDLESSCVWDDEKWSRPYHYTNCCFKIKLKKDL